MSDMIYGRQAVRSFLKSSPDLNSVIRVLYASQFPKSLRSEFHRLIHHPAAKQVTTRELDQVCDKRHQGIIVKLKTAASGTDPVLSWKELLVQKPGLYVLTDRIQDPGNLGSIIRSAEALGASGLFVTGKGARRTPLVDRISAGASFHIPVIEAGSASGFLSQAKKDGYWILASAMAGSGSDSGESYDNFEDGTEIFEDSEIAGTEESETVLTVSELDSLPKTNKFILVIGHEGEGIRSGILRSADFRISIPMKGKTESLNAAVAAAILMERILSLQQK